jgi:phosphopantetheine adenylyltransferase
MLLVGCCSELGNRKASLDIIDNNSIILKFDKNNHVTINLPKLSKKREEILFNLQNLCEQKKACFSLKVNDKSISIIVEDKYIKDLKSKVQTNFVKNRILSIDLNPNYVGLSVCDWHTKDKNTIIHKEIIDVTSLNKLKDSKYKKNKRDYETSIINKHIIDLVFQYHCELVAFEHLDIESKDHCLGKRYNRLVNNCWNRKKFLNNLIKRCKFSHVKYKEVYAMYSSFIGQLQNPTEYDSVAASIELSRRANLMNNSQYKGVIYPRFDVSCIPTQEPIEGENGTVQDITSWQKLYALFKKSKIRYRFLFALDNFKKRSFRLKSDKSLVMIRFV